MSNLYLTPTFEVYISGKKLSLAKKAFITSVKIKETVVESDSATLEIIDPNYEFLEDDIFVNDNKIKILLGFQEDTYRVKFDGYISDIGVSFPSDGSPKLTITCMDRTHIMNRKKKNKTFSKTNNASVVKKIVQSYGFKCVIEEDYEFTEQDSISQSNQTDINFIQSLASNEVYPFTARLVGDTFYYVKKGKLGKSVATLKYKEYPYDVISIDFSIDKQSKQEEIESTKISSDTKKISSSVAKMPTVETPKVTAEIKTQNTTPNASPKANTSTTKKPNITDTYDPDNGTWTKNIK